jgi:hypothetical protein
MKPGLAAKSCRDFLDSHCDPDTLLMTLHFPSLFIGLVVSRAERIFDYEQVAHGTALQGFNGDLFFLTANILFKQPRSVEAV